MVLTRNVDGGWAWIVLVSAVVCLVILGTMSVSVGFFQTEFLDAFEGSAGYTSFVCSLCLSLQCLLGPLASIFCNMFSVRAATMVGSVLLSIGLFASSFAASLHQLLVFYGILTGIGFGITYMPCAIVVGFYFDHKRVLANGITLSSSGFGILLGPHLIGWLIENYGWRHAVAIFSCVTAQISVLGMLFIPTYGGSVNIVCCKQNIKQKEDPDLRGMKSICDQTLIKNKILWICALNYHLQTVGYSIQLIHFPSYVKTTSLTLQNVALLYTIYGGSLIAARVLGGLFANNMDKHLFVLVFGTSCIQGFVVLCMPLYATTFVTMTLHQIFLGFYYGFYLVLVAPICVQLFGLKCLASAFGLLLMAGGFGGLVGPPIAGWLFDRTRSYSTGFHIGGSLMVFGSLFLLLIPVFQTKGPSEEKTDALIVRDVKLDVGVESEC